MSGRIEKIKARRARAEEYFKQYSATAEAHVEARVILLFYAAVHVVGMVAAHEGRSFSSHMERMDHLRHNHPTAHGQLRPLYQTSRTVRYNDQTPSITPAAVGSELFEKRARELVKWAKSILGTAGTIDLDKVCGKRAPKLVEPKSVTAPAIDKEIKQEAV